MIPSYLASSTTSSSVTKKAGGRASSGKANVTPSSSKKENRQSLSNAATTDSDTDFDYDTSSTISELEDELLTLPDDDELTEPENDQPRTTPSKVEVSQNRSIPLSPQSAKSNTSTSASSRKSLADSSTLSDSSLLSGSLAFEDSSVIRQSIESARGRKSSLVTNADVSLRTTRRSSTTTVSVETPTTSKTAASTPATAAEVMEDKSLLLSSVKKLGRQSTESRRVSFGGLSPIDQREDESPTRSTASTEKSSINQSRVSDSSANSSPAASSVNTTVRTTTPSSVQSASKLSSTNDNESTMQQSSIAEESTPSERNSSFYDAVDDYGAADYPDFDDEAGPQDSQLDASSSRRKSSATSSSNKRNARSNDKSSLLSSNGKHMDEEDENTSRLESSNSYTPKSVASSSSNKRRTPGSIRSMISTPGSNDFPRGRRISDSSFHMDDDASDADDDDKAGTDEEELDTTATTIASKKGGKKGKDLNTTTDSFAADTSFLNTISSANKNYAGKKILAETKKMQQEKKTSKVKKLLGLSDDEMSVETESDNSDEGEGVRRSRRATKGRRFAFWKGERPLYQEGTMVGLMQVEPTPVKAKKGLKNKKRKREEGERLHVVKLSKKEEKLPEVELPDDVDYLDPAVHEVLNVWDNYHEKVSRAQVLCCADTMGDPQPLPTTAHRPPGKNKCGFASHLLSVPEVKGQMPAWTSGKPLR